MDISILTDVYKLTQSCKLAATTYLPQLVSLSLTGSKDLPFVLYDVPSTGDDSVSQNPFCGHCRCYLLVPLSFRI
jgi:hypothetical protein